MNNPSKFKYHYHRDSREAGFTLIESTVAIIVALTIVAAAFAMLNMSSKTSQASQDTADTQQNVRMAMELIARDIKSAGFGMMAAPETPVGGTGSRCSVGVGAASIAASIVPTDDTAGGALTAQNDDGPDSIALVVPRTGTSWQLAQQAPTGTASSFTTITLKSGAGAEMVAAGLVSGDEAYISIGGVVAAKVTDRTGDVLTLKSAVFLPATFPQNTQVYLLQCVQYAVSTTVADCGNNGPCLVRRVQTGTTGTPAPTITEAIADGIEDLQFAYACDGCNPLVSGGIADRIIDDQNTGGVFDQADFITNRTWTGGTTGTETIRLVQVNIVARQLVPDQVGLGDGKGRAVNSPAPLTVSDHPHTLGVLAAGDYVPANYVRFRRRVLTKTVQTRNMGT